ncbi:hypothetical protein ACRS6B_18545 [Nocardia asteroides]
MPVPVLPWRASPRQHAAFESGAPSPRGVAGISCNLNADGFTPADVLELPNDAAVRAAGPAWMGGSGFDAPENQRLAAAVHRAALRVT